MKTIRQNTFETNSSSTHSLTILSLKDLREGNKKTYEPLVVDGVLIPGNLRDTFAFVDHGHSYESSWTLTAKTKDEKAALLFHHLLYYKDDAKYDDKWGEELYDIFVSWVVDEVVRLCGYSDVNMDFAPYFMPWSEDSASYCVELFEDPETCKEKINDYIVNIVCNDDKVIVETETPYH